MKVAFWIVGVLLALIAAVFGLQLLASETGEVVVLHARDAGGEEVATRLWVADHAGSPYLRVGADGSGWYARLTANPAVRVTRAGATRSFLAVAEPALSDEINSLMRAKYGWRDELMAMLVGGRDGAIPIRLQALP